VAHQNQFIQEGYTVAENIYADAGLANKFLLPFAPFDLLYENNITTIQRISTTLTNDDNQRRQMRLLKAYSR
jgi:hypothetical protein